MYGLADLFDWVYTEDGKGDFNAKDQMEVRNLVMSTMFAWYSDLANLPQFPGDWYIRAQWCRDCRVMTSLGHEEDYWRHEKHDFLDFQVGIKNISVR